LDRDEDHADDDLLAELRDVVSRVDPVPPELMALAEASLILRTIDTDLAALSYDSALDTDRLAMVRGAPTARMLTFDGPGLTVEVETQTVGRRRRLVGQLVPPQAGQIEVRQAGGGVVPIGADDAGSFVTGDVEPGPVSLRCRITGPTGPVVVDTDWFLA
jgi:hypothetical protein